jgi:hypothetical protein
MNPVAGGYRVHDLGQEVGALGTALRVLCKPVVGRRRDEAVQKLGYQLLISEAIERGMNFRY